MAARNWWSLALLAALVACRPSTAAPATTAPSVGASPSSAATSGSGTSAAPVKLTVSYAARGSGHAGAWHAYEGGYFREQGLDVNLTYVPSTPTVVQAMVAGEVQLSGIDASAALQASLGGADLVLLFAGANRPVHSVYAQPRITEPALLRGGTVGITRAGSATHTAAKLALGLWGLLPDRDVAFRQLGQNSAILVALQAGQIDAGLLAPPLTTTAHAEGYRELIDLSRDGPEYPSVVVAALRDWITANPDTVQRLARAYTLGRERALADKDWAFAVYRQYLEVDDPVLLEDTHEAFIRCCAPVPHVSAEGLARLLADQASEEPRLAGRQASEFMDDRFLEQVEAERPAR